MGHHAHLLHDGENAPITLNAIGSQPFERDARTGKQCLQCQPERSGTPVAFAAGWCGHVAVGWNGEFAIVLTHPHAMPLHQRHGHVDIGSRNDVTRQLQFEPANDGRYHQQRRDKLRTDIAPHGQVPTLQQSARDAQRSMSWLVQIVDVGPQLAQSIDQRCDGPLAQAGVARDSDSAPLLCGPVGGEETQCRSRPVHIDGLTVMRRQAALHHEDVVTQLRIEN